MSEPRAVRPSSPSMQLDRRLRHLKRLRGTSHRTLFRRDMLGLPLTGTPPVNQTPSPHIGRVVQHVVLDESQEVRRNQRRLNGGRLPPLPAMSSRSLHVRSAVSWPHGRRTWYRRPQSWRSSKSTTRFGCSRMIARRTLECTANFVRSRWGSTSRACRHGMA